jgi:hypothetical protein
MSSREMMLGVATFSAALVGLTVFIARPRIEELSELRARQADLRGRIEADNRLLGQRGDWERKMVEMRELLSVQPAGKNVDVHWLSVMDTIAAKHGVRISTRQAGEERKEGDVYELPIECKEWQGTLESLVYFLFELQSEGAMLDVRQLVVRPGEKGQGQLRGRFTLYCAYTREN